VVRVSRRTLLRASLALTGYRIFGNNWRANAYQQRVVYFARVLADYTPIYKAENGQYEEFAPLRNPIYKGSVLRLCDVGAGYAQIIDDPEPGAAHGYSPWRNYDHVDEVFIQTAGLLPVLDLSPISVYPETGPGEKLILISLNQMAVAVYENGELVLYTPAGLGKSVEGISKTLDGFGHLVSGYTTTTMGDYAGVPYPLYVGMVNQPFSGQALHGAYWYDWDRLNRGYWGSAGCINLPTRSKYDVIWYGERVPIDEFVYRWSKTNLQFDPYSEEGYTADPSIWEGVLWYQGVQTVRVIVVNEWWELDNYPNSQNQYHTWQPMIDELVSMGGLVRLPDTDVNGVLTFRQKPASELP